jgi:hypothetical protein
MGLRNMISSENENRTRRKLELESAIADRNLELQRLKLETDSLVKLEADQQAMIHHLLTMEPTGNT